MCSHSGWGVTDNVKLIRKSHAAEMVKISHEFSTSVKFDEERATAYCANGPVSG